MATPIVSQRASVYERGSTPSAYVLLYIPALLAWLFASDSLLSYGLAWAGSWWILWVSMTGRVRTLPADQPWRDQLLRPLFLSQAMFFGLFCVGSVFQMWDLATASSLGYRGGELQRIAAAQRYYVLGHAAFVHGMLVLMNYRRSGEWSLQLRMPLSKLFLVAAGISFVLANLFGFIPGMGQFEVKLTNIVVAGTILGGAYAVRKGNLLLALSGMVLYGFLLYNVFLSGWKSQVMIVIGFLLLALYPRYKKTVWVVGVSAAIFSATLLPAYTSAFRELNWNGEMEAEKAAQVAVDQVISGEVDVARASNSFLENRLSKISLFTDYIRNVPGRRPYYGFSTVRQAAYSIIPRVLWPGKPDTEETVNKRVYENVQSVRPGVRVSAKPSVVVDGYIAGGIFGVFLACFLLGFTASVASRYAERWFGGYEFGGQLIYTGLFARVLFVPSFEFLFNALFWSFVLMLVLAYGLQILGITQWAGERRQRDPSTKAAFSLSR